MNISTIIPVYNEEQALASVVKEYLEYSDEIVIVNDGSTDNSVQIGETLTNSYENVSFISRENNEGKACALRTGVTKATGEIVVFTDADMTYPAKYIPEMERKLGEGADLVLGSRVLGGPANIPLLNKIGNQILSFTVSFLSGILLTDTQTGLRAMKRKYFEILDVGNASNLEFETRMTARAAKLGYNVVEVPIQYRERVGESKLHPFRDGWRMLLAILATLFHESSPILQVAMGISSLLILAGLYTGGISIIDTVQTGVVQHEFYPLLTALFFILAFQIFTPVLAAEQVKNRINRIEEMLPDEND